MGIMSWYEGKMEEAKENQEAWANLDPALQQCWFFGAMTCVGQIVGLLIAIIKFLSLIHI